MIYLTDLPWQGYKVHTVPGYAMFWIEKKGKVNG